MQRIGELFKVSFELERLAALNEVTVVLEMHVTFSARAQRASASRLPVVELLDVVNSRVDRSRVYISDTAALFRLKPGSMPAFRAGLCI